MAKYTLIAEHTDIYGKPTGHKVTHEFTVDDLPTVLQNTDLFLRGVGFMPASGHILDYVPDDTYYTTPSEWEPDQEWHTEEFETPTDDVNHSEYYFDTERNK